MLNSKSSVEHTLYQAKGFIIRSAEVTRGRTQRCHRIETCNL
jgi:hypothetical protein